MKEQTPEIDLVAPHRKFLTATAGIAVAASLPAVAIALSSRRGESKFSTISHASISRSKAC